MYAFRLRGGGAEAALPRLLPALDGRVGVVRTATDADPGPTGRPTRPDGSVATARPDTEYVLEDGWRASGEGLSVQSTLDRLAPDHDVAVVLGETDVDLPSVIVGGGGARPGPGSDAEEVLVSVADPSALDPDSVAQVVRETEPYETLESLVAAVKRSADAEYAGAIATFTGRVREREDGSDDPTEYLEFEKYEGVADGRMRAIERDLEERDGVLDVRLHHRTGRVEAGEDIVFVVVLAGHREEAFRTVEDGIDRLKDEVPLFKKEVTTAETFWVHERER